MMRSENGFTLVGALVTSAIVAVIAGGAAMGTVQIIQGADRDSDRITAVRQAQNAGYWVSNDATMARKIDIGDDSGTGEVEFIILYWKDWETGDTHEMRYIWLDSSEGLKKLKRKHLTRDKDGLEIGNRTTFVADNIYTADLSEQDGGWKLGVETRSGTTSETREYEIIQRLDEQGAAF